MKILYLTSRFPYPPYRGDKLRNFNWIKALSRDHEIILMSLISSRSEFDFIKKLEPYCKEIHVVQLPVWKSWLNCLTALVRRIPFQIAYYQSSKMHHLVKKMLMQHHPDLIHTHLLRMAQYSRDILDYPKVIDLVDAVGTYLTQFSLITRNPVYKIILGVEAKRVAKYETTLSGYQKIFICSELDAEETVKVLPKEKIKILANGVDTITYMPDNSIQKKSQRIIFTGNMSYAPNIDGAQYFAKKILPLVREEIPDAKFYIVGQSPSKAVRMLVNDYIVVTGFVDDIRSEYLKSDIAVSPIRFGSGTLNKVLEPMALGIPVVATNVGVEGLGVTNGENIYLVTNGNVFARQVIRLLKNPNEGRTIAQHAREFVKEKYDWQFITQQLVQYEIEAVENQIKKVNNL